MLVKVYHHLCIKYVKHVTPARDRISALKHASLSACYMLLVQLYYKTVCIYSTKQSEILVAIRVL